MATSVPHATHSLVVDWDVADLPVDLVTVEALARLQLAARRHGCTLRLRNAPAELTELLVILGLRDVLRS